MKNNVKILSGLSLAMVSLLSLTSCKSRGEDNSSTNGSEELNSSNSSNSESTSVDDGLQDYVINTKCFNGKPLMDVVVTFGEKGQSVYDYECTDLYGNVTFRAEPGIYKVTIDDLPGYTFTTNEFVTDISGTKIEAVANANIITDQDKPFGTQYSLGDVVYDFEYTTIVGDKKTNKLSYALEDYDLVVLNFWFTTCSYCDAEFPYLNEAYKNYKDKNVLIIAIDNGETDTAEKAAQYAENNGLAFDVCMDTENLAFDYKVSGDPTSVFIDRYGLIGNIHVGAITNVASWESEFDKYLGSDYVPKFSGTVTEDGVVEREKPTILPQPSSKLEQAANGANFTGKYTHYDDEYNWPWIVSDDGKSIKPSNSGIDNSYAIVSTKFKITDGNVLAFDYKASSESNDSLYVFVDGAIRTELYGLNDAFKTYYLYTTDDTEEHELAFAYRKDYSFSIGDDCVYINNIRYVAPEDINEETYILKDCASGTYSEFTNRYFSYITPVFNSKDGYYHVNSVDGPLVLANLTTPNKFTPNTTLYTYTIENELVFDGVDYNKLIVEYSSYQSNSKNGFTPVTKELHDALVAITNGLSESSYDEQWLEACVYYQSFGGAPEQEDPIKGLAFFSAYEAVEGDENYIEYDRIIMPRGLYSKFVPTKSGVYIFASYGEVDTEGWILDANGKEIGNSEIVYRADLEVYDEYQGFDPNFKIFVYLEEGQEYYLRPVFWDVARMDTLNFGINYYADSADLLVACSLLSFEAEMDPETGELTGDLVTGGIKAALQEDGYYHYVDDEGNVGSIIYADFTHTTSIFDDPLITVVKKGGFDFTKDEDNNTIVIDDTTVGVNEEDLVDLTNDIQAIIDAKMIQDGELKGCIMVDEELAVLLQKLMDKYTFKGVENSWLKLCYYYAHYGK